MAWMLDNSISSRGEVAISPTLLEDLQLSEYLKCFFDDALIYLTADESDICRRNGVIRDFMSHEAVFASFEKLYEHIRDLSYITKLTDTDPARVFSSLTIFKNIYDSIADTEKAISACADSLASDVFERLRAFLEQFRTDFYPENFLEAWDSYASGVEKIGSQAYRFNFDDEMKLRSFSLHSVRMSRYKKSIFARDAGEKNGESDTIRHSIALKVDDRTKIGMHYDPQRGMELPQWLKIIANKMFVIQSNASGEALNSVERRIYARLEPFYRELSFFIGAVRYARSLELTGMPVCFASVCAMQEGIFDAHEIYHPLLAENKQGEVTKNNVAIGLGEDILIVSGANRGGKTTYLRSAGAVQVLFQLGLPVPAKSARISPVTSIACSFSGQEDTQMKHGKLGQELQTLRDAVKLLTAHSLFLFNEPISATSPIENYLLSREVLSALKVKGARGIWVTHLYNLVDEIDAMNEVLEGSVLASMYATANGQGDCPDFSIRRGKPDANSYAQELMNRIIGNAV